MATLADQYVRVRPDMDGFPGELKTKAEAGAANTGKQVGTTFGKGMVAGAASIFAAGVVVDFFKGAIAEANEAAKVTRLTAAAIKSTGGAANVSAGQVAALAERLSELSGVDDEVVQSGANVLLTFTKIKNELGAGNDVFDQATAAALDMSAALGTDLQGAIVLVGKSLNDPIQGMTALRKAGVQLTEAQKEQIKTLVEQGKLMDAQKVILGELTTQFGGAAAAAATPADKARVAWGNLQEELGNKLLPTLNSVLEFGIRNQGWVIPLTTAIAGLAAVIGTVIVAQKAWAAVQTVLGVGLDGTTVKVRRAGIALAAYVLTVQGLNAVMGTDLNVQTEALAENLEQLGKSGTQGAEVTRLFGENLHNLEPALMNATSAGRGFSTWVEGLIPGAAAADNSWTKNIQRIQALDTALASLVSSGNGDEAARVFERVKAAAEAQGISMEELSGVFPEYTAAAEQATGKTKDLADGIHEANFEGRDMIDVWNELNGTLLNADEAMLNAINAVERIGEVFRDGSKSIEGNSKAALENRVAIERAAAEAVEAAADYFDLTGDVEGARARLKDLAAQAVNNTKTTGDQRAAVQALVDQLFRIPPRINSTIVVTQKIQRGSVMGPLGAGREWANANGSIMKFYAAGGLENHVAQIARAGSFRIWGEPETGGEAYIPMAFSKRQRSTEILSQVASQFGFDLVRHDGPPSSQVEGGAYAPGGMTWRGGGGGGDMGELANLVRQLIAAVENVAPGVAAGITGGIAVASQMGRAR